MNTEKLEDPVSVRLGRRIRVLRAEHGWSQEVLGELAGVHRSYIGQVERARIHASIVQLARIAKAFGLSPGTLIDGPTPPGMNPPLPENQA